MTLPRRLLWQDGGGMEAAVAPGFFTVVACASAEVVLVETEMVPRARVSRAMEPRANFFIT